MTGPRAALCAACLLVAAGPAAAQRLPADVVPLHYQLVVTPDLRAGTFDGSLTIDLQVRKATDRITLHAADIEVRRWELALPFGRVVHPSAAADAGSGTVTLTTPSRLAPGTLKLHVEYGGRLRRDGRAFFLARSHGRTYAFSQMEATDARRAFPCFDEPAFKASFALSAVIDERLSAISNGPVVSDTPGPAAGTHTVRFGTTPRISTYLVALAVGEFACASGAAEGIPVRVCTVPEQKGLAPYVLDVARRALLFDAGYFTFKYPFRKLDLVAVPGRFPGAMENAGAIFFDEGLLVDPDSSAPQALAETAAVVSHEVAHQWLGNVVTPAWWDDLWISEGLATWMESKPLAAWKPQWRLDLAAVARASDAMRVDALRSTRAARTPVATEAEIEESFDGIAYGKAASVFRMVESWIGPESFRAGLNAFVRAHAYETATGEDLWGQLAAASGDPVEAAMRPAMTRAGVPVVAVSASCDGSETVVSASQRRFTADGAAPPPAPPAWWLPLAVRGVNETSPALTSTSARLAEPLQTFRLAGCFPAVLANAGATGYYVSAYEPAALARFTAVARDRLTPAERIRLLNDTWATTNAGTSGVGSYLALVRALSSDPTPEVIEEIERGLTFIDAYLTSGDGRAAFEASVRRIFGPVAAELGWKAAPGEDEQRGRLRAAVLETLGLAGNDAGVLGTARALMAAHVSGGTPVERALVPVATRLAARTADAALLGSLVSLDAKAALGGAGDAALVTRTLADALSDRDGHGDLTGWLEAALGNPAVNLEAWRFLETRWAEIQPRLDQPFGTSSIVAAAGSLCDGAAREGVARVFAGSRSGWPRTLQLTLDRIDACRDSRLRLERPILEWLK